MNTLLIALVSVKMLWVASKENSLRARLNNKEMHWLIWGKGRYGTLPAVKRCSECIFCSQTSWVYILDPQWGGPLSKHTQLYCLQQVT